MAAFVQRLTVRLESFVQGFEAAKHPPLHAIDTDQQRLFEVWRLIDGRFNQDELRTLAFFCHVEYDSLPAEGKSGKARELVAYMERHEKMGELLKWCQELQPGNKW